MGWLKKQYDDIKGNLKWAIVTWLVAGSGLTGLAHFLQAALQANIASWLSLAAPIFSILAVVYLLIIFPPEKSANTALPNAIGNHASSTMTPLLAPLPRPLPVDLHGEIEELFFFTRQ